MPQAHFILYVQNQAISAAFYEKALGFKPRLDVPGMTEFELGPGCILGLMPAAGIKRLLGEPLPDPQTGHGIPRAELYLKVEDPQHDYELALAAGATLLSPPALRNWGDITAYCLDPDGHVLAFAKTIET